MRFSNLTSVVFLHALFHDVVSQDFLPKELQSSLRQLKKARGSSDDSSSSRSIDSNDEAGDNDCELMSIYLKTEDIQANTYLAGSFIGETGSFYGGQYPMYDSESFDNRIGDYEFATNFLNVDFATNNVQCVGNGSYTFGEAVGFEVRRAQITWTATCANSPFFTITGGQKEYSGAKGYSVFDRQLDGGLGSRHDIYLCNN